jgi:hypothetical protein
LDAYGNIEDVHPFGGAYTVALPGAICNEIDGCPVGGAVALLAQSGNPAHIGEITAAGTVPLAFDGETG